MLHLGNICAFAAAWLSARVAGGRLVLRIEDVDRGRARPVVERAIRDDLLWLGLTWDDETAPQSQRSYDRALEVLAARTYRCTCTRAMLAGAGGRYPGTCRGRGLAAGAIRFAVPPGPVSFIDRRWGPCTIDPARLGDPVLVRSDGLVSYPLAVVADDIADGVTEVVRGSDLLEFTAVQIRLHEALGASPPTWLHGPLILGSDGRKLSKSHGSAHVTAMRDAGALPSDVWAIVLPWLGLPPLSSLDLAISLWRPNVGALGPIPTAW